MSQLIIFKVVKIGVPIYNPKVLMFGGLYILGRNLDGEILQTGHNGRCCYLNIIQDDKPQSLGKI